MPVYSQFYLVGTPQGSSFGSGPLSDLGPQLPVEVHLPNALANHLSKQSQPVPKPASGNALFDTGASLSVVDETVIQSLGVQPVGVAQVGVPTGSALRNVYPVRFVLPGTPLPAIETTRAIGGTLQPQGIIALIGRDVLAHFVLVYNGPGGFITLAF